MPQERERKDSLFRSMPGPARNVVSPSYGPAHWPNQLGVPGSDGINPASPEQDYSASQYCPIDPALMPHEEQNSAPQTFQNNTHPSQDPQAPIASRSTVAMQTLLSHQQPAENNKCNLCSDCFKSSEELK
jgi:hypothetical protein